MYICNMKKIILFGILLFGISNLYSQVKISQYIRTTNFNGSTVPYIPDSALMDVSVFNFAGSYSTRAFTLATLKSTILAGETDPFYSNDSVNIMWFKDSAYFVTPHDSLMMHNWIENNFIKFSDSTGNYITPHDTTHTHAWIVNTFIGFSDSTGHYITPYDTVLMHNYNEGTFVGFADSTGHFITPYDTLLYSQWINNNFLHSNLNDTAYKHITFNDSTLFRNNITLEKRVIVDKQDTIMMCDSLRRNTSLGYDVGHNTGTVESTFIGYNAGHVNNANYNTGIGARSMPLNTTGTCNTGVGAYSFRNNTIGSFNVGIGYDALHEHHSGDNNVALGALTLFYDTTGEKNVAIGSNSLKSNTNGFGNVANGYNSLFNNKIGFYNTAIGLEALFTSTGVFNTGVGLQSLYLSIGDNNTAIGNGAGYSAGSYNVFLGNNAGYYYTGSNKLFIANSNADSSHAFIYGNMDATLITQRIRLNGNIYLPNISTYTFDTTANKISVINTSTGLVSLAHWNLGVNSFGATYVNPTTTITWTNGNCQTLTLTGSTSITYAAGGAGRLYYLKVTQGGTGSYALTFNNLKMPGAVTPILTSTVGSIDILTILYDGTNYNLIGIANDVR